jgi:hypothetical protein
VKKDKMVGACNTHRGCNKFIQSCGGQTATEGLLGKQRRIWNNIIKMDLTEIGSRGLDWIQILLKWILLK